MSDEQDNTKRLMSDSSWFPPPVRGLVLSRNRRGRAFPFIDQKKWIRLCGRVFKNVKIDYQADALSLAAFSDLAAFSRGEDVRLSLRIDDTIRPGKMVAEIMPEVMDIYFCPRRPDPGLLREWGGFCSENQVPLRVRIMPAPGVRPDPEKLAENMGNAVSVNVALSDPFANGESNNGMVECKEVVRWMNALTGALDNLGVEANLIGLPFCHVDQHLHGHVLTQCHFFLDHQQYDKRSYELAERIQYFGPARLANIIESLLARGKSNNQFLNNMLFPWLIGHPVLHARVWALHRLRRHLGIFRKEMQVPGSEAEWTAAIENQHSGYLRKLDVQCRRCKFLRVCDRKTKTFASILPDLPVQAIKGETVLSRIEGDEDRKRYYDVIDAVRCSIPEHLKRLSETAIKIISSEKPSREIPVDAYQIENNYNPMDDSSKRWYSLSTGELLSTVLGRFTPPFTLLITFGGGIAEQVGFSFGRYAKILCPMIDYSHKVALHVDAEGIYVLLRDGVLMRPTELEGMAKVPERLSDVLEPRISIHNIDGFILTQTLLVWEDVPLGDKTRTQAKYSVLVVSTRYTRRLQAVLLALAHQTGIAPDQLEVVVAYVPGIDATDDLLNSMAHTHPHLRIVRSTFSEEYVHAKGFMINESVRAASGKWIVLMDSDIIVPPDIFEKINALEEEASFIVPDGRKMLTPEMTSKILLGEICSWEAYEDLSRSTEDCRYREGSGVPCGFFQCVRREVLETIPYYEFDHFEGADWFFGQDVVKQFGPQTWLEGVNVLHLDHGGRQWYGTQKHK